jgi:hypothetical protein
VNVILLRPPRRRVPGSPALRAFENLKAFLGDSPGVLLDALGREIAGLEEQLAQALLDSYALAGKITGMEARRGRIQP